jgi:4-diphosphocytidyl-2-C-methyl-D-erythritol kinase
MPTLSVPAFAKVNLRLDVLSRQADGYHELRTIFQSLSLHDTLRLETTRGSGIELRVTGNAALAGTPPRENLVWRALAALKRELKLGGGIRAELEKRVPVGRGLGGGSSDAAAALAGLLRLSGKRLAHERLLEIAASLGADVPFFLFGGRALGVSRGDEIYPQADLARKTVLVVSPRDIFVSTKDAYAWIDERLTTRRPASNIWRFCALCWSPQGTSLSNDFEKPVFRRHPRLAEIKRVLLQGGAAEAALAGSGSAVFGIFRNPAQARRAAKKFPEDQVFVCSTISRRAYVRSLWGPKGYPGAA